MEEKEEYILCLDLSLSCTGVAILDKDQKVIFTDIIPTDSKDGYPYRLKIIADKIKYLATRYPPSVVVIERGFSRYHLSSEALWRVQGVAMLMLWEYKQILYSPSTVKKCLTGRGNSSKDEVKEAVLKIYPSLKIETNDISDAIGLGITYFRKGDSDE